jgi:predicted nucleotidyltransferase
MLVKNPMWSVSDIANKVNATYGYVWRIKKRYEEAKAEAEVEAPAPKLSEAIAAVAAMDPVMEKQVGGSHYKGLGVEPWDAMQAWLTREEFIGFLKGNVLKYMARANFKNHEEDIKKAAHYLEKLLSVLKTSV